MCVVHGKVVLGVAAPEIEGRTLLIVEPVTAENLAKGGKKGGGVSRVVVDELGANVGQLVGIVEGREGANPFWPEPCPVDAYLSLIVDKVDYHPPAATPKRRARPAKGQKS